MIFCVDGDRARCRLRRSSRTLGSSERALQARRQTSWRPRRARSSACPSSSASPRSLRGADRLEHALGRWSPRRSAEQRLSKRCTSPTPGPCRDSRLRARRRSTTTCSSNGIGENCGCFRSSVRRAPRASSFWVEASRSEPNCANAAISRYCASSPLIEPDDLLHRLDLGAEPTRLTETPTFIAGRMP